MGYTLMTCRLCVLRLFKSKEKKMSPSLLKKHFLRTFLAQIPLFLFITFSITQLDVPTTMYSHFFFQHVQIFITKNARRHWNDGEGG